MKIRVLSLLLFAGLIASKSYSSDSVINLDVIKNNKPLTAIIAIPTIGYASYLLYSKITAHLYETKVNSMANSFITALRTNFFNQNNEKIMREKAQLINRRLRVMKKLEHIVPTLPTDTYDIRKYSFIKSGLNLIDPLRQSSLCFPNPYEKEYIEPSMFDNLIEDQIVDSFVLSLKFNGKCTKSELLKKEKQVQLRKDVYRKIDSIVSSDRTLLLMKLVLQKIKDYEIILSLFFN